MPTIQDHISLDALTEGTLSTLKAIGVDDIAIMHPTPPEPGEDQSPLWRDVRRTVEAHGMRFFNIGLRPHPSITLGRDGRDDHIKRWCALIRSLGAAGVPSLTYNFRGIGNFRTESAVGRGGALGTARSTLPSSRPIPSCIPISRLRRATCTPICAISWSASRRWPRSARCV